MKFNWMRLTNFGSYPELEFTFDNKLSVVTGPNGSGKSTLFDAVAWCLYGKTAKSVSVDGVVSWGASQTTGEIELTSDVDIRIKRIRGIKSDLVFFVNGVETRGKDVSETQDLLTKRLGVDYQTMLAGTYYYESNQTTQFFTAPAKIRRQTIEQLVDLSELKRLTDNLIVYKKEINKEIDMLKTAIQFTESTSKMKSNQIKSYEQSSSQYAQQQREKRMRLEEKIKSFESQSRLKFDADWQDYATSKVQLETEIQELEHDLVDEDVVLSRITALQKQLSDMPDSVCQECGNKKTATERSKIEITINGLKHTLQSNGKLKAQKIAAENRLKRLKTPVLDTSSKKLLQTQLEALAVDEDPYEDLQTTAMNDLIELEHKSDAQTESLIEYRQELADAVKLQELSDLTRLRTVETVVSQLEESTNKRIEKHFDGEFRVEFNLEDAETVEVVIRKGEHECTFQQLSKGQRQILKLCFGVAVMEAVKSHHAVGFNTLMFDEALDGMSDDTKVKAYGVFESLDYENILVIEHSEAFKSCFSNQIVVSYVNGESKIKI